MLQLFPYFFFFLLSLWFGFFRLLLLSDETHAFATVHLSAATSQGLSWRVGLRKIPTHCPIPGDAQGQLDGALGGLIWWLAPSLPAAGRLEQGDL